MAYEKEHACEHGDCTTKFIARSPRRRYCDNCRVKVTQQHEKNRYKREGRERRAAYVSKNSERVRQQTRDRYHKQKDDPAFKRMRLNWRLRTRYGITAEDLDEIGEGQGWRCAICGRAAEEVHVDGRPLHVDHDHALGAIGAGKLAVRGLLCFHCNTAVGNMLDDPEIAQRLVEYVMKHAARRDEFLARADQT